MPAQGLEIFDAQQMQQMQQALMSMAANLTPAAAGDGILGGMPQVDPALVTAYMQMYLQAGIQQQAGLGISTPGIPPLPFPYSATPSDGVISVSVEGMKFQYQLTEDDLLKVFSRYGNVSQITVDGAGSAATIAFSKQQDAQSAMNDLNGKVLNGLEGTLRINWVTAGAGGAASLPYAPMPFGDWGLPAGGTPWPGPTPDDSAAAMAEGPSYDLAAAASAVDFSAASTAAAASAQLKGARKYTCRFLIGIENDKDFQVARRIIGPKGMNMKRIFKQTEAKLRLRGRGSGYFEGAGQRESTEPLQLCISCTSPEGYKLAVRQAEELLKRLYEEYKVFCREAGRPAVDLHINFSENQLVYSRTGGDGLDDGEWDGELAATKDKKRARKPRPARRGEKAPPAAEDERGAPGPNAPTVEDIEKCIDDRNEARRACNFAEADRIREALVTRGVALMDEPGGRGKGTEVTTWRYWRD